MKFEFTLYVHDFMHCVKSIIYKENFNIFLVVTKHKIPIGFQGHFLSKFFVVAKHKIPIDFQ